MGESTDSVFIDSTFVHGLSCTYLVQRRNSDGSHSCATNLIKLSYIDKIAPSFPTNVQATPYDAVIRLTWNHSKNNDVAYYEVGRNVSSEDSLQIIESNIRCTGFEDLLPPKGNLFAT